MKRTPLKRSTKPIKQRIPVKTKKQLQWEKEHTECELCGSTINLETHHIQGRLTHPELLNEPSNWARLCGPLWSAPGCHELVRLGKINLWKQRDKLLGRIVPKDWKREFYAELEKAKGEK
jgi:hypothetical protein